MGREAGLPNQRRMDPLMQAWDQAADNRARAACDGRSEIFSDYENPLGDHSEAKEICASCDIFNICKMYAREVRPGWGFWAGKVWVNGKQKQIEKALEELNEYPDTALEGQA